MKLQRQLDAIRAQLDATVDPEILARLDRGVARLTSRDMFARALRRGAIAPDFVLPDQRGTLVTLAERLVQGPAVVVFMRGEWCPYCAATIQAWQSMYRLVEETGAAFLMVSPQSRERTVEMTRRRRLGYQILNDRRSRVATQFGIAYEIEGDYREFVQGDFDLDVGAYNGTLDWRVPVSATYVIDSDRRIALAHVNPDHRLRLEPEDALVMLARLRSTRLH